MSLFEMYLLTRLNLIHDMMGIIFLASIVALAILGMSYLLHFIYEDMDNEGVVRLTNIIKKTTIVLILAALGGTLIPSNKQLAVIFAGHWSTNSEEVKKLPDNVIKTMNNFMDKYNNSTDKKEK